MDPKGQFVCYLIAFIFFVIAAVWDTYPGYTWRKINLIAAGLAAFTFVFLYTAYKAI